MSQIADDLGHERAWNLLEKKEDGEGVPFYLLLAPEMHHGVQNLVRKKALVVSSMAGEYKVIVSQIANELGHERVCNLRGKERGR